MARPAVSLNWFLAALASMACTSLGQPTLVDGVITYTAEDGSPKRIDVGKPCQDLWVAPDESVLAFVTIDRTDPDSEIVLASSIYIARKADHFVPIRVGVNSVRTDNADWSVFVKPSVSPDGSTVFFMASFGNYAELFSHDLKTQRNTEIGLGVTDYCTIRSGVNAGSVVMLRRFFGEGPDGGFAYICYRNAPGRRAPGRRLGACSAFDLKSKFGAACTLTR